MLVNSISLASPLATGAVIVGSTLKKPSVELKNGMIFAHVWKVVTNTIVAAVQLIKTLIRCMYETANPGNKL